MKKRTYVVAILAIVAVAFLIFRAERAEAPASELVGLTEGDESGSTTAQTIESYVRENIGKLSPVKPVLGGAFYVTEIEAHGGAGTVRYEDGHIAEIADFIYSIDEGGEPHVNSFAVRK